MGLCGGYGYSADELKAHLEQLWTNGMSWDNYGEWHIDHIKPCAMFDLTKSEEQKKCFNYTNLRPLWGIDNLHKSSWYKNKLHKKKLDFL